MEQLQTIPENIEGSAHSIQTPKQTVKEAQWTELIRRCQAGDQTVKEWCRSNGINENTYYYWLKRLRKKALGIQKNRVSAGNSAAPVLVEVPGDFSGRKRTAESSYKKTSDIRISFHGAEMEVGGDTSPELLRMILAELSRLPIR